MPDWLLSWAEWLFPEFKIGYLWVLKVFTVITFATVAGGILGFERELLGKPAGLRTLVFVTVGSALFAFLSFELGRKFGGDPMRIASNIATGIGFLGAGTIVRRGDLVEGLTTSAIIWVCGALGIIIGAGYFATSVAVALGGLIFLKTLELAERTFIWRKRCSPKNLTAIFHRDNIQEIINFSKSFKIPSICKINHIFVITPEEDTTKINFQVSFCNTHTDIPILRSAEKINFF